MGLAMDVLNRIRRELARLSAEEMRVSLDADFVPEAGELVRIDYEKAYWHLLPQDFHAMLEKLPDAGGAERVRHAIESDSIQIWHGPSPKDSLDERT
jgi:hypothetical protein